MIKVGDKVQHVKTKKIGTVSPFVPMPGENGDLTQQSATMEDLFDQLALVGAVPMHVGFTADDKARLDAAIALHGIETMRHALLGWFQVNREMDFDWFITHIPQNIDRYRTLQKWQQNPQKVKSFERQVNPMTGDYTP